ncbi:MAG TPA: hypothetical protein VIR27_20990 [Mycobacteriales bacterium]
MRHGGVLLALWLVVAGAAIAVGTWALSMVGGEINHQTVAPLSDSTIDARLRADQIGDGLTGTVPTPVASDPVDLTATGTPGDDTTASRILTTVGGTVTATCRNGLAYLNAWIPAQGYRADDRGVRGPAEVALVKFESDTSEVTATVRCVEDAPIVSAVIDSDHHGVPASGSPGEPTGASAPPAPTVTDDHGSGGHGADDGTGDDHRHGGRDDGN